jgi:hypothetical protein
MAYISNRPINLQAVKTPKNTTTQRRGLPSRLNQHRYGPAAAKATGKVQGLDEDTTDEDLQEMKSLVFEKCRSLSATFGVEDEFPTDDVPSFE